MATYTVVASRGMDAAPEQVYAVLSDVDQHRKILPKEFRSLVPESGNIWRSEMQVWGQKTLFRLTVTQVEPGRVFTEVDEAAGASTVWTLNPVDGCKRCEVTLATTYRAKPGFAGWVERLLVQRITPGIYGRELANLAAVAGA
ncbi:MAG TPA: SRPBCC family protein [Symbiobacteriaceae bacterium]|nr:SRPBCC family protein [Symbiobacteriaceae bacterium]